MELIDLFLRHQLLIFGLLAALVVGFIYLGRRWLLNIMVSLPSGAGALGDSMPAKLRISLRDLVGSLSKMQIGLILAALFLGIAAIGFFEPVPKATALPLPPAARDLPENKRLLVFVHGWGGDPQASWQIFPGLVLRDTRYQAFNLIAVSYPTFYARRNLGVRAMARWLNDRFEREQVYQRYDSIWLITHSMGGLIARELLIANRLQRENSAFKLLIEIATPHQGAAIAPLANTLGVSRGFVADLEPDSAFLSNLRDDWNALRDRPKTFCLTSPHDMVVSEDSAIAQCDEYLRYPQWGHIDMVKPQGNKDERYLVPMSRIKSGGG